MFRLQKTDSPEEISVTVSSETYIRLALLTGLMVVFFFAVKKAEHALILVFAALLLTIALNGPVYWLSKQLPGKRKGSRVLATSLSYLLVVIVVGAILAAIVPSLIRQTDALIKAAPHLIQEFKQQNSPIGKFIRRHHLQNEINSISTQLSSHVNDIGGTAFSTAKLVGDSAFDVVTILVMTFMMLVDAPRWVKFFKDMVPNQHHKTADRVTKDMYKVVRGYFNGQVFLALLAASLITPVVLLMHVGYAAGIFVLIFICGLIPMVGHSIGAVIVFLIALLHSPTSAIVVLICYGTYIALENYIIQPKIQANTTNMPPILVFVSVIIGVSFGGIFGGLVAIPVAGCIRIVVLEYLYSKNLINGPELKEAITQPGTK